MLALRYNHVIVFILLVVAMPHQSPASEVNNIGEDWKMTLIMLYIILKNNLGMLRIYEIC